MYKIRRDELRYQAENEVVAQDKLSDSAKTAITWINSLGKGQDTCQIIYAAAEGKSFNLYGVDISFSGQLPQPEINTLWSAYRAL